MLFSITKFSIYGIPFVLLIVGAGRAVALPLTLYDDFNDNSIDPTKWDTTGNVVEQSGQLRLFAREAGIGYNSNANTEMSISPDGDPIVGFRTDFDFDSDVETQWGGGNMWFWMRSGPDYIRFEYNNDIGQMQVDVAGIYGSSVIDLSSKSGMAEVRQQGTDVEILHDGSIVHTIFNTTIVDSYFEVRTDSAGGASDKSIVLDDLYFYHSVEDLSAVPEPSAMLLLGFSVFCVVLRGSRKRSHR